MRKKTTVIGAETVRAGLVQRLAAMELGDLVVMDAPQRERMQADKALDLAESAPALGSDIVVIIAGIERKPGMSRDDLLETNAEMVKSAAEQTARVSPNAILIIISNPLDAICRIALRASGFSKRRVIGMAGTLDGARMRSFIAEALDVSVESVQAMVLGGYGSAMVPLRASRPSPEFPSQSYCPRTKSPLLPSALATARWRSPSFPRPTRPATRPTSARRKWWNPSSRIKKGFFPARLTWRGNTASTEYSSEFP